jgi:hypothetical protein
LLDLSLFLLLSNLVLLYFVLALAQS